MLINNPHPHYIVILLSNINVFCVEIDTRMMNKCTGYWLDDFVRAMATCKSILPKFISMENNLI